MRQLVYYVAASIDGFIADADGGADFFAAPPELLEDLFGRYPETCPAHVRAALGITDPPARFDAVVMGARTHEPAVSAGLTSAYPHLDQYVVTHRDFPTDDTVTFVRDDPTRAISSLKQRPGRAIWLCGGGDLAAQLVDEIDELQVKRYPVVVGTGVPLFSSLVQPVAWELRSAVSLPAGVILETYAHVNRT